MADQLPAKERRDQPRERRTFAPVVGGGLLAAGLAAVAGAKPWGSPTPSLRDLGIGEGRVQDMLDQAAEVPLASALSLVVLAAWGALLVTRGKVRTALAALGTIASLGLLATVVSGLFTVPDAVRSHLRDDVGAGTRAIGHISVQMTGWYWLALVAAVCSVVAFALAVRVAASWPAMGSRYDAPGSQSAPAAPETEQELWRALDEGHDPT